MHNHTWKREKALLSEAYQSIFEQDEPVVDVEAPPVDDVTPIATDTEVDPEPDEVDAEIESLVNLLKNPDPSRIDQYAASGNLHEYIDMLQAKLKAAEAVKSVVRGDN